MKQFCVAIVILLPVVMASCTNGSSDKASPAASKGALIPEVSTGNTVLYVSNQSYAVSPVDIRVLLDGQPIIDSDFTVGDQHNYVKYQFELPEGKHILRAESDMGGASIEQQIEISPRSWGYVGYWYKPGDEKGKRFTVIVQDEPIYFR